MTARFRVLCPAPLLLALLLATLASRPAAAQSAGISWNGCSPSGGNRSWPCDRNTGSEDLVVWIRPFTRMTNVTGAWTTIVLSAPGGSYPAWWQIGAGACRPGGVSYTFDPTPPFACSSAWSGQATGTIQVVTGGSCGTSAIALQLQVDTTPGVLRTLETTQQYDLFRLRILHAGTIGAGACAGCSTPICIGTFGVGVKDNRNLGWWSTEYAFAHWQGADCTGAPWSCGISPVRPSTWGSIKSLYR